MSQDEADEGTVRQRMERAQKKLLGLPTENMNKTDTTQDRRNSSDSMRSDRSYSGSSVWSEDEWSVSSGSFSSRRSVENENTTQQDYTKLLIEAPLVLEFVANSQYDIKLNKGLPQLLDRIAAVDDPKVMEKITAMKSNGVKFKDVAKAFDHTGSLQKLDEVDKLKNDSKSKLEQLIKNNPKLVTKKERKFIDKLNDKDQLQGMLNQLERKQKEQGAIQAQKNAATKAKEELKAKAKAEKEQKEREKRVAKEEAKSKKSSKRNNSSLFTEIVQMVDVETILAQDRQKNNIGATNLRGITFELASSGSLSSSSSDSRSNSISSTRSNKKREIGTIMRKKARAATQRA